MVLANLKLADKKSRLFPLAIRSPADASTSAVVGLEPFRCVFFTTVALSQQGSDAVLCDRSISLNTVSGNMQVRPVFSTVPLGTVQGAVFHNTCSVSGPPSFDLRSAFASYSMRSIALVYQALPSSGQHLPPMRSIALVPTKRYHNTKICEVYFFSTLMSTVSIFLW